MKQRPVLVTRRLVLRALSEDDADTLVQAVISDPQIMKSLLGDPSTPSRRRELALRWVRAWNQHWLDRGFGVWGIHVRGAGCGGSERLAGFCGFVMDTCGKGPELLYALARPYWGQSIATEAACASAAYLFDATTEQSFQLVVTRGNVAAARIAEKIGGRYAGEIPVKRYLSARNLLAKLDFEVYRVRKAVKGTRTETLVESSFRAGQLVAAGRLDPVTAQARLLDAAHSCGLLTLDDAQPVWEIVRRGLAAGMDDPHIAHYVVDRRRQTDPCAGLRAA
jgi:ribosomal-protein-alanine N-acetyltransferase